MNAATPTLYDRIDGWVVKIIRTISYISAICLVGIMLVAFFNVIGEKLRKAGMPITGIPSSTEIVQYLHIPVVFLAAAYVTLDRGHTRIDLLCSRFPKALQSVLVVIGNLLGAGICSFVSYCGFGQMIKFYTRNKMSSVTGLGFPLWPFALIMAVGFVMLALTFLWDIVRLTQGKSVTQPKSASEGGEH